jgi:hypothetical protein
MGQAEPSRNIEEPTMNKREAKPETTEPTQSEPTAKSGKKLALERKVVRTLGVKSGVRAGDTIDTDFACIGKGRIH